MPIVEVDPLQRLMIDGEPFGRLTPTEEAVLRAILTHSHVATKDFILTSLCAGRDEPELKIVDVYVAKIRAKLGKHRAAIVTIWGRGYARNPGYSIAPKFPQTVAVGVDASLVEEVSFACGEGASELIARLLRTERKRLWANDATEAA